MYYHGVRRGWGCHFGVVSKLPGIVQLRVHTVGMGLASGRRSHAIYSARTEPGKGSVRGVMLKCPRLLFLWRVHNFCVTFPPIFSMTVSHFSRISCMVVTHVPTGSFTFSDQSRVRNRVLTTYQTILGLENMVKLI